MLVDGADAVTQALQPGAFELRVGDLAAPGRHKIELRFEGAQRLPGNDGRLVSARLHEIGFGLSEIVGEGFSLGRGCTTSKRLAESRSAGSVGMQSSRVREGAEASGRLELDAAPGPGVHSGGFNLALIDQQGTVLNRAWVTGRQKVQFPLPGRDRDSRTFYLRAEGARSGPATADDPRQLDFRVFRIGSPQRSDIASGDVTLGRGWYDYETFDGESFRWVGEQAELRVSPNGQASSVLELDVAPGPGMDSNGLVLALADESGAVLSRESIPGRRTVRFTLTDAIRHPPGCATSALKAELRPECRVTHADWTFGCSRFD